MQEKVAEIQQKLKINKAILSAQVLTTHTRTHARTHAYEKETSGNLTDSFKVINVIYIQFLFLFLYNLLSLLNKLTKFHLILSDDYEKKYTLLTVPLFVYLLHILCNRRFFFVLVYIYMLSQ